MKKILFLTTNNLATNPRLLKEVKLALDNNYDVTLACFNFVNWSAKIEEELRASLKGAKIIPVSATRKSLLNLVYASVVQSACRNILGAIRSSVKTNAYASDKRSFLLKRELEKAEGNYDLIISHNLGALFPAYDLASRLNSHFAFDVEDYHPGETILIDSKQEVERRQLLMKKLLPKASYISYASTLIGEETLKLVPELVQKNHFLINNCFYSSEFTKPATSVNQKLQFVWFSQNIAQGRGLELVLPVLFKYRSNIELTLIGNLNSSFHQNFLKRYDGFIKYIDPLPQHILHMELSKFDIGLAIEISSSDLNKEIAVSNKIFAYAQSGLYIMATNTKGQKLFIDQNPFFGETFIQTAEAFENSLLSLLAEKDKIIKNKNNRFESGQSLSWDKEGVKLLDTWRSLLN